MGRRFARHLDLDAIARVERGQKPHSEPQVLKHLKPPRHASTYRAARRNEVLRTAPRGTWKGNVTGTIQLPRVRANRSRKWAIIPGRMYREGAR